MYVYEEWNGMELTISITVIGIEQESFHGRNSPNIVAMLSEDLIANKIALLGRMSYIHHAITYMSVQ